MNFFKMQATGNDFILIDARRMEQDWAALARAATPVAPPFIPNSGPMDGSLSARATRLPMRAKPWASPIETVVLPSPAGVGVIAETRMSWPSARLLLWMAFTWTLALEVPKAITSSAGMSIDDAISAMGRAFADWAISISVSVFIGSSNGRSFLAGGRES